MTFGLILANVMNYTQLDMWQRGAVPIGCPPPLCVTQKLQTMDKN